MFALLRTDDALWSRAIITWGVE